MMLLEHRVCNILRVVVLTRNSLYSALSVEDTCLQNGGAPIVSRESFNFIIMKAIFGHFFSEKCYLL